MISQRERPSHIFHLRALFGQSLLYGLGSFASKAVGFILLPIYTRVLTPEDYGVIDLLSWLTLVMGLLVVLEVDQGAGRYFYDSDDLKYKRAVVNTGLNFQLITLGVMLALIGSVMAFWPAIADTFAPLGILTLALIDFALTVPQNYLSNLLRWNMRVGSYVTVSVMRACLLPGLSILLVVILRKGVSGYFVAALLGDFFTLALCWWLTKEWLRFELDRKLLAGMLRFAVPLVPYSISIAALQFTDRYLIQALTSRAELGLFAVASKACQIVVVLSYAYHRAWGPWAMSIWREKVAPKVYGKAVYHTLLLFSVLISLTVVFAREGIRLMTGREFWGAYPAVFPLLFGALAYEAYHLFSLGAQIAKRTVFLMWTAAIAAAVNIPLAWFLTRWQGFVGAAWALPLGYLPSVVLMYWLSQQVYAIPYPVPRLLLVLAMPLSAGWLALLLDISFPFWWSVLGKSLVAAICVSLFLGLGGTTAIVRVVDWAKAFFHGSRRSETAAPEVYPG